MLDRGFSEPPLPPGGVPPATSQPLSDWPVRPQNPNVRPGLMSRKRKHYSRRWGRRLLVGAAGEAGPISNLRQANARFATSGPQTVGKAFSGAGQAIKSGAGKVIGAVNAPGIGNGRSRCWSRAVGYGYPRSHE